jgi:prepilin-type N-terminal cleavage/methylation domain-containing protein
MSIKLNYKKNSCYINGFTLVELMVTISIIALLSTIVYASFSGAREQARDKSRMSALKELQLAVEQYKAQYGVYPSAGCGATTAQFAGPGNASLAGLKACTAAQGVYYIGSSTAPMVPDYITKLPFDTQFEFDSNRGFYYRSDGVSYKIMVRDSVEALHITSFADEFARCPQAGGGCPDLASASTTYAVYSIGAEQW